MLSSMKKQALDSKQPQLQNFKNLKVKRHGVDSSETDMLWPI